MEEDIGDEVEEVIAIKNPFHKETKKMNSKKELNAQKEKNQMWYAS